MSKRELPLPSESVIGCQGNKLVAHQSMLVLKCIFILQVFKALKNNIDDGFKKLKVAK